MYTSYMRTYVHVAFLLCLASACGSRPVVDDYDAACASDEECIIVHDGCAYDCHCGTGALSVAGAEDFDADVEGYCALRPPSFSTTVCDCIAFEARCTAGQCEMCESDGEGGFSNCR